MFPHSSLYPFPLFYNFRLFPLSAGCLSWHCRAEPKVGDRIPSMKYDTLMPEDIEPYLNGRSYEDLKVGDEIVFPEDDTLTPESLVGRRIKVRWDKNKAYDGTIEGFDASTDKHQVTYDDGDKKSYDFKGDEKRKIYTDGFVFEGAEAYFDGRGVCIIRKLEGGVNVNAGAN